MIIRLDLTAAAGVDKACGIWEVATLPRINRCNGRTCVGLGCVRLGWVALGWAGLSWIRLGMVGLGWVILS